MQVKHQVAGYFKIEAFKQDASGQEIEGSRRVAADWFPNLITDGGLNRMGNNSDYLAWCQVGTGSTTPATNDTQLVARVGSTSNIFTSSNGRVETSPRYTWRRNVYRFAVGAATGNLAEVGIGWGSTADLFSRALILDSNELPDVITILSDEVLDVTYEFRFYPLETDLTGSVTLTGNIGGTYNWTMRAADFREASNMWAIWGSPTTPTGFTGRSMGFFNNVFSTFMLRASSGGIAAINALPSVTLSVFDAISALSYVDASLERKHKITLGLTDGNIGSGIKSIALAMGIGGYQIEFNNPIPKTSSDLLELTLSQTWGRKT